MYDASWNQSFSKVYKDTQIYSNQEHFPVSKYLWENTMAGFLLYLSKNANLKINLSYLCENKLFLQQQTKNICVDY
jgi:hypothetical protein